MILSKNRKVNFTPQMMMIKSYPFWNPICTKTEIYTLDNGNKDKDMVKGS
jgi:hypothetical protein